MADVHTKEQRSYNMSRIKGKDTKPEMLVRRFLHANGYRYKLHDKKLPGKPDIVLKKYQTVVLIHGCFWHGHKISNCKLSKMPKSNVSYWHPKIKNNKLRDIKNKKILKQMGWNLIEIWECQLVGNKKQKTLNALINKLYEIQ